MLRDIDCLTTRTFDVLIVGGGIYGLTIARDAAQRGLSVALIERHDFGSGSSFNHLRTIHGGLRYLQTLDFARARESTRERSTLARIAAPAIAPLPFVLPLPNTLARGRLAMRTAFLLDAFLARERNAHVPASHHLPSGCVLGRRDALARYPALAGMPLAGAAIWHDYVTVDADRLTLAWALAAAGDSATLANYVEARALRVERGMAAAVHALDRRSNREIDVAARVVVNATGGALDRLLTPHGAGTGLPMLTAMNLVTRLEAPDQAIAGRSASGRTLFMLPWRGRALFGTFESPEPANPTVGFVRERDVSTFIADINGAFPTLSIRREDVSLVHHGVVPARRGPDGALSLEADEQIHDASPRGLQNVLSVAGTKYTTARAVAERVTDRILQKLRRAAVPCRTASTPLPFSPLTGDAQLAEAAANEMVVTLEDAVVRRTLLGAVGEPDPGALAHAADVVAGVLGWDATTRQREIEGVRKFYGTLNA